MPHPSPQQEREQAQQALVQSIHERRLRWRQQTQARALGLSSAATDPASAPIWAQLAVFARRHPVVTCAVAAAALTLGPKRVLRWAVVAVPWLLPSKR
jgi:hypothetical protein